MKLLKSEKTNQALSKAISEHYNRSLIKKTKRWDTAFKGKRRARDMAELMKLYGLKGHLIPSSDRDVPFCPE